MQQQFDAPSGQQELESSGGLIPTWNKWEPRERSSSGLGGIHFELKIMTADPSIVNPQPVKNDLTTLDLNSDSCSQIQTRPSEGDP